MIRILIYIIMVCALSTELQAQKDINLIISVSVDENIIGEYLSGLRLIAAMENGTEQTIEANYYPGKLSLKQADYDRLLDISVKTVFFSL